MPITTAEELLRAQHIGRCELVRGELRMLKYPGFERGRVTTRILLRLHAFAKSRGDLLPHVGFVLARGPDTVRAPDAAFVRAERIPAMIPGYFVGAPDLAVEVVSPESRRGEVREKVTDWLEAGAGAVWVLDPHARTVVVHEPTGIATVLGEGDKLHGHGPLAGFEVPVGEIFAL